MTDFKFKGIIKRKDLEAWAKYQGRPTANLGAYLVESGIRKAKEKRISHKYNLTKTFWLATTLESAGYYYLADCTTDTQIDFGQLILKNYVRPRHFS